MINRTAHALSRGWCPVTLLLFIVASACGDSASTPTQPTSPPPATGNGDGPVIKFAIKGDELGSRDPIAMLSEVAVDASASTGTGALAYTIDFGDGTSSPGPVARHTFQAAGTYTVNVEARDAQGRRATAAQQVVVKSVNGAWYHAAYNPTAKMVEVRRLTIAGQDGLTVRGVFAVNGQPDRTFSATLAKPRNVRIVVNSAIALEGVIPSVLNDENGTWPLQMQGESVDGQRLEFRTAIGDPTSASPDAILRLGVTGGTWGRPVVYAGVPMEFDGSASQGSRLSYFFDFGDGQVAAQERGAHAFQPGFYNVELTAVDGLGRYNRERTELTAYGLHTFPLDSWFGNDGAGHTLFMLFNKFDGRTYSGWSRTHPDEQVDITGTLGPNRDVRIVVATGVEYRGLIEWVVEPNRTRLWLTVTQFGGANNGATFRLVLNEGP